MQDQPTAAELVGAVRDFIQNVAMPKLEARDSFHARVAANALGIVQRELEIAPEADAREHERLATLLDRDGALEDLNRELCTRIRNGKIDLPASSYGYSCPIDARNQKKSDLLMLFGQDREDSQRQKVKFL